MTRHAAALAVVVAAVFAVACTKKDAAGALDAGAAARPGTAGAVKPSKLEPLERVTVGDPDAGDLAVRESWYHVAPFTPVGPAAPAGAVRVEVHGEIAVVNGVTFDVATSKPEVPVVLVPDADTYLAQAAALLEKLDDAHREVWLAHPDQPFAYRLALRDEPGFQAWIDDPVPGKLRVIQRADGFELQTNLGKLPGGDPNGPSVPVRGGEQDLATLQKGFERIQKRFKEAPDLCFVPSFATPLAQTARAMAANYVHADTAFFPQTCLVYPRPRVKDAGR